MTIQQQQLEQELLRILAETPAQSGGVRALLRLIGGYTHASGVVLVVGEVAPIVFAEGIAPDQVPSAELLFSLAADLNPAKIHVDNRDAPSAYHGLASLVIDKKQVGVLWFTGEREPLLEGEVASSLLQALTVLTRQVLLQAYYEKINRNQMEFFRIVLHDLRTPLTSARGFADMLLSGNFAGEQNDKQAYALQKILSNVMVITSIVDNVQDAGRYDPETGFYEMQRSLCDLVEIVQRIVDTYIVPAEKQELTMHTDIEDVPIIQADRTMLERAITNLVDNAIKYTPNGGRVDVGLKRNGENIEFYVRDSGYGISPAHQKTLFQRHVRIPREEHKRIKGTGLGLFIVRSVAQHHGGQAWVRSEEGNGSTFGITIPLSGASAPNP